MCAHKRERERERESIEQDYSQMLLVELFFFFTQLAYNTVLFASSLGFVFCTKEGLRKTSDIQN